MTSAFFGYMILILVLIMIVAAILLIQHSSRVRNRYIRHNSEGYLRIDTSRGYYKIYIRGLLHLSIPQDSILAVQTWVMQERWWHTRMYCIEYHLDNGESVESHYVSKEIWKRVISATDKVINEQ